MTEKVEDLGIVIAGSKEEALWLEIKKEAEKELEKLDEMYFKSSTFQKAVLVLARQKLDEIYSS